MAKQFFLDKRTTVSGKKTEIKLDNALSLRDYIISVIDSSETEFDSIATDVVSEKTAAAGITVDGVLVKDGTIALVDGAVNNLSVKLGTDKNNGIYGISDTQLGIAVEGVLVGGANTAGLFTDVLAEQTTATGVTVDGVLLKDGGVSANSMVAGFYPTAISDNIAAGTGGAISVTNYLTTINTDADGDAFTLANGTQIGQMKLIKLVVDGGGNATITPATNLVGPYNLITLDDAGDYILLIWNGTAWAPIDVSTATLGTP